VTTDGKYIISSSYDQTICIWDAQTRVLLNHLEDEYVIISVTFLPGTHKFASTSMQHLKLWDSIENIQEYDNAYLGHEKAVKRVMITPDGRRAVSLAADYSMKVWDLATGSELAHLPDAGTSFTFTADGYCVSVWATFIKVWDTLTWRLLKAFPISLYIYSGIEIVFLQVLKDNRLLVCSRSGQWTEVNVFDLASGKHEYWGRFGYEDEGVEMFKVMAGYYEPEDEDVFGHTRSRIAITPDEQYAIFYLSHGQRLKAIQLGTSKKRQVSARRAASRGKSSEEYPDEFINFALLDKESREKGGGSQRESPSLFDREGIYMLSNGNYAVWDLAISADGQYLFLARISGAIEQWDIATSKVVRELKEHTSVIRSIKLFSDGHRLVSVGDDASIKIWNISSGQCISTFNGVSEAVHVEVSANSRYLLACNDLSLHIWDITTGQIIASFYGETAITHFVVSPDGHDLVLGEVSGRIHFLRLVEP